MCRATDDQTQDRIQRETTAILKIVSHFQSNEWKWINSGILRYEISRIRDIKKRSIVDALLISMPQTDYVSIGKNEILRGQQFEKLGFRESDALHIACAESGKADFFLTTDDAVIRKGKRFHSKFRVQIKNPETWLKKHAFIGGN